MKVKISIVMGSLFFLLVSLGAAFAEVTLIDDAVFGSQSIILDTDNQREFLRLNFTAPYSYAEVVNEFGEGGMFEGWGVASRLDMEALGRSANVVTGSTDPAMIARVEELRDWFGEVKTSTTHIYARGLISDITYPSTYNGGLARVAFSIGATVSPVRVSYGVSGYAGEDHWGENIFLIRNAVESPPVVEPPVVNPSVDQVPGNTVDDSQTSASADTGLVSDWVSVIDFGQIESPGSVICDDQSNCYINGYSGSGDGKQFRFLSKVDKDGTVLWKKSIDNRLAKSLGKDSSLVFDLDGNILMPSIQKSGFKILKFNKDGELISSMNGKGANVVSLLTVDAQGNRYIAGEGRKGDWVVQKIGVSGKTVWSASRLGDPTGIAVDHSGNLYVSGMVEYDASTRITGLLVKYSPDGQELWCVTLTETYKNLTSGVEITPDNGVVLVGASFGYSSVGPWVVNKYSSEGNLQWVTPYSVLGRARDVMVSADGSVYVTGDLYWGSVGSQIHKYTANGMLDEVVDITNNAPLESIFVTKWNEVITTGAHSFTGSAYDRDCVVYKYKQIEE